LLDSVSLTHLFVGQEEYLTDVALMERLAKQIRVVVIAESGFTLPEGSAARILTKPFYCFPVAAVLNEGTELEQETNGRLHCIGVKALVVDDEPMNLTVARSILGKYGIEVSTADSGQRALEMCSETAYDIVFMDHMMPGMDGVETMKRIRSATNRLHGDMPIVALTANAVSTAREMFIREGFDGFVSKPIDLVDLERVLRKVLPVSKITYLEEDTVPPAPDQTPQATAAAAPAAHPSPYEILTDCGVDTETGLQYSMQDEEFYRTLLLQFASEAKEKRAGMERYYADKAFGDYEILVHALKSTAKMIGCEGLSEGAKALEFAAKAQDAAYIEAHHAEVMEQYDRLTEGIRKAFGIQPDETPDEDEALEFAPEDEALEFAPEDEVLEFAPEDEALEFAPEDEVLEFAPEDEA
ncbi:MAG: response regulator, partial [Oscillospiraceae bacterium]|nr:response regulator [Oscillospiraceae bacterium]